MDKRYLERALFVAGATDSGKSMQLRSMFRDLRFGTHGVIPTARRLADTIRLSNDRNLYLKLMSPHEQGDDVATFIDRIEEKTRSGRWCFAGALQIDAAGSMPDMAETIRLFVEGLSPERTRVCLLSPDRRGGMQELTEIQRYLDALSSVQGCEYVFIDARHRDANGLFLADFFDFA